MKILLEFLYKSYPPANAGLLNPKDSLNLSRTIEMLHDMDFPIQNVDSAIMEHFKELEMLINAIALAMKNPTQISGSEDTSLRGMPAYIFSSTQWLGPYLLCMDANSDCINRTPEHHCF